MLADPRHSWLILINLGRGEGGGVSAKFIARWRESLSLLAAAPNVFGVGVHAVGEYDLAELPEALAPSITPLGGDALSLWRNKRFTASLAASNTDVIFLGG